MATIYVLNEACKGIDDCGICRFVCPKSVFGRSNVVNEKGLYAPVMIDEAACVGCENCMIFCPDMAIIVETG